MVLLTPQSAANKVALHREHDGFFCFDVGGFGPALAPLDLRPPAFPIVVGWEYSVDNGTQPLPCRTANLQDYIAALYFDLSGVIRDGGAVDRAVLRFRRSATTHPISVPARAPTWCSVYALAPLAAWHEGYYVGSESDSDANPPATLLFNGTPRTSVRFRNSADPADARQELDVTTFLAATILRRADRYHGLLLSPRSDPSSSAHLLTDAGSTSASCTGVLSDFQLEMSLVRLVRGTP